VDLSDADSVAEAHVATVVVLVAAAAPDVERRRRNGFQSPS